MRQLHRDPFSEQFFAVEVFDGVVCIPMVFEFHKAEAILEVYVTDAPVALEEPVNVFLPDLIAQMTNKHPGRHGFLVYKARNVEENDRTGKTERQKPNARSDYVVKRKPRARREQISLLSKRVFFQQTDSTTDAAAR